MSRRSSGEHAWVEMSDADIQAMVRSVQPDVDRILEATGCDQVHVAQFTQYTDTSTANNRSIFYGGALYPPEDRYDVIDGAGIAEFRRHLQ